MKCEVCVVNDLLDDLCLPYSQCPHYYHDCYLTSDHQRIIDAMIRGVFGCKHCKFESERWMEDCFFRYADASENEKRDWFCPQWQECKEGEDG